MHDERTDHLAPLPRGVSPVVWDRALGSIVWATDGRELVDLTSGVLIANLGHSHPAVVEAVSRQVARLSTTFVGHHPGRERYAGELLDAAAAAGAVPFNGVCLATTGAEAVDAAVRIARAATGRRTIVAFLGGYHGKTTETSAFGGMPNLRGQVSGLGSSPVLHVPYPSGHDAEATADLDGLFDRALALAQASAPEDVAAVLIEPYLGAGGGVVPPAEFLDRCRGFADRLGARLIVDEVQSGFGRTGPMFAFQTMARPPDLVVLAKGIANGIPMSAVLASSMDLAAPLPGNLWSSYSANPVACAAASATLKALHEEVDASRTIVAGNQIVATIDAWDDAGIRSVHGGGFSLGIALRTADDRPDHDRAREIVIAAADQGAILLPPGGPGGASIRLAPPLTSTDAELERGLDALREAFERTRTIGASR